MNIIQACEKNLKNWARLTQMMYPYMSENEALLTCKSLLDTGKEKGYLAYIESDCVGFINISLRVDYVNGTISSPVLFIESIYVEQEFRGKNIARSLVAFVNNIAKQQNISEIASDCKIENVISEAFHKACGFKEQERVICFTKPVI